MTRRRLEARPDSINLVSFFFGLKTTYCYHLCIFTSHVLAILHRLQKSEDLDHLTGRPKRRRCKRCYSRISNALGYKEAGRKTVQVTTVCIDCPGKPHMCSQCFYGVHSTVYGCNIHYV